MLCLSQLAQAIPSASINVDSVGVASCGMLFYDSTCTGEFI